MAELKEGQHVIFKHPASGAIRTGRVDNGWIVFYNPVSPGACVAISEVTEWYDAEEAFNLMQKK